MTNLPVVGQFSITAVYGQSGKYWKNGHQGIDIVADDHQVYATCDGIVRVVAYDDAGWGQYVSIGDDQGRRHIFCHLQKGSVKVKAGQSVNRTTVIGIMGATGNVSGLHLHYQLQNGSVVIDPTSYLGVPNKVGKYHSEQYQISKGASNLNFVDEDKIAAWAKSDVKKVTDAGIMKGDDQKYFRPNDPVTRQELAVVIARIMSK